MPFTNTETLTVTRKADGSYNATTGIYTAGADTEITITASVQPTSGKEMERLEINRREKDAKTIYTRTELKNNDFIEIDGNDYEVDIVEDWSRHPFLKHYKAIATRLKDEGQRL